MVLEIDIEQAIPPNSRGKPRSNHDEGDVLGLLHYL
jgi:hypothetical protein